MLGNYLYPRRLLCYFSPEVFSWRHYRGFCNYLELRSSTVTLLFLKESASSILYWFWENDGRQMLLLSLAILRLFLKNIHSLVWKRMLPQVLNIRFTKNILNIIFTNKDICSDPVFNGIKKCLAPVAQIVKAFSMNPTVGCSPHWGETFCVK